MEIMQTDGPMEYMQAVWTKVAALGCPRLPKFWYLEGRQGCWQAQGVPPCAQHQPAGGTVAGRARTVRGDLLCDC